MHQGQGKGYPQIARVMGRVHTLGTSACWLWLGDATQACDVRRYLELVLGFRLDVPDVPAHDEPRCSCGVACVNPAHFGPRRRPKRLAPALRVVPHPRPSIRRARARSVYLDEDRRVVDFHAWLVEETRRQTRALRAASAQTAGVGLLARGRARP